MDVQERRDVQRLIDRSQYVICIAENAQNGLMEYIVAGRGTQYEAFGILMAIGMEMIRRDQEA